MSPAALLERPGAFSKLLCKLIITRTMGGGPRTFPGGLNKWQWKRMHEKRAKEKEMRLLEQEKQIYQARVRSQIRAELAGKLSQSAQSGSSPTHGPMTPTEQIKALADRFMKEGAVDLWNEADGPLTTPVPVRNSTGRSGSFVPNRRNGSISSPIDLRKLIPENLSGADNRESVDCRSITSKYVDSRSYSVQSRKNLPRNESSSSEDDSGRVSGGDSVKHHSPKVARTPENAHPKNLNGYRTGGKPFERRKTRFWRDESSSSEDESDLELEEDSTQSFAGNSRLSRLRFGGEEQVDDDGRLMNGKGVRRMGSSAALGKHDMKKTRRVPPKPYDEESDFREQVELIRHEINQKKAFENLGEKNEEESLITHTRFDDCGISPLTVKALSSAGYIHMTRVQDAALPVCLEGKDVLVKAKTGTGKSAAFLLPAIEAVLKATASKTTQRVPPIFVLILCPTRELASQIAAEAKVMLKYHDDIGVQTLVGGTRFKDDQKRLESYPSQIIVATPGRLLDHVENKSGLSVRLMGLKMLIVDEADLMLDLGFRRDIEKIVDCLPRQKQSLLFSATIPREVRRISQLVLRREHVFVDTVGFGCVETPVKIKQSSLIAPHVLHFQIVHNLLKDHISQTPDYKVIVFCSTGMVTSLMYLVLRDLKMNVREIHSRKPQLYRTRISEEFKLAQRLILVTSDVSARGMNYPDVTLVIQVGIPSDREQYIHRLGRTGREGKGGEGILLIAPWEEYFLDELKELPLQKLPVPNIDSHDKIKIKDAISKVDTSVKEAAYHAWLGYYNSISEIGRDKTTLVELANQFSESIYLQKPPALFRKTALKMGLRQIPGIKIRK